MPTSPTDVQKIEQRAAKRVIVCVDRSASARTVIAHALPLAHALRLPITLLQVVGPPSAFDSRLDPIDWAIRRHEARDDLERMANAFSGTIDVELTEGSATEGICRWAQLACTELTVLGTHGERGAEVASIGRTARHVLERGAGAILFVPISATPAGTPSYRRILVPLDGSPWSTSVLPLAVRLAQGANAELILVHALAVPELMETALCETNDSELLERLVDRNEKAARSYLDRVQGICEGLRARTLTLRGGDVRSSLKRFIGTEHIDLVVLSARGQGGDRIPDMPYGSVADYLITHSPVPVLLVKPTGPLNVSEAAIRRATVTSDVRSVI